MISSALVPAERADAFASIIKAYDIRGVVPDQWDEASAMALGAAVADVLGEPGGKLAVGHDMRPSSPHLVAAFEAGVMARGVHVVHVGLCSTDGLYFVSGHLDMPGAMFTASHNPAQYNGIKLCRAGAQAVSQETGLAAITKAAQEYVVSEIPTVAELGEREGFEHLDHYANYLRELVDLSQVRPLKIVVDAGNGMGGLTVPAVLGDALPNLEIVPLYFELDGTFPNHEANPLEPANLVDLQKAVVEHSADLGLAFDGDADRCFVVDHTGGAISPSAITALVAEREIAADLAAGGPGIILHNAITSQVAAECIAAAGGKAIRTKVGHSHIKAEMAKSGAVFGGEHSAHYYFKNFWGADTGILAAMHILAALGEFDGNLADMMAPYHKYVASGEINSKVADAAAATERAIAPLRDAGADIDSLDGVTASVASEGWWVNVRPSNTEPLLRLNVEARDEATMVRLRDAALAAIRAEN